MFCLLILISINILNLSLEHVDDHPKPFIKPIPFGPWISSPHSAGPAAVDEERQAPQDMNDFSPVAPLKVRWMILDSLVKW